MITISVESDEEQWAVGTALVNGVLAFGNWPFQVRRVHSLGPGGGAGYSGGGAVGYGGPNVVVGGGGNGGGSPAAFAGGTGVISVSGTAGGGGSATVADFRWNLGSPLRSCCATMPGTGHLQGCDETGG